MKTLFLFLIVGRIAWAIPLLNPWKVSLGFHHSCALDDSGIVCWGSNNCDQFPNPIEGEVLLSISAGKFNTCVATDKSIRCEGRITEGLAPNSCDKEEGFYKSEVAFSTVENLASGDGFHCAINNQRKLKCWHPHKPSFEVSDATQVSVNEGRWCAIINSNVKCDAYISPQGLQFQNPTQIAVGGGHHACALDDSGVQCWGSNNYGQTKVPFLVAPRQVVTGRNFTCALDSAGVQCWGDNFYGQTKVPALFSPKEVAAGYDHACAIDDTGVVCWGNNSYGQTQVPQ